MTNYINKKFSPYNLMHG